MSDHEVVITTVNLKVERSMQTKRTVVVFKKVNMEHMEKDLRKRFGRQYESVFINEDITTIPNIPPVNITSKGIDKLLVSLDPKKSNRHDEITAHTLGPSGDQFWDKMHPS
jgi:hypothetical protein